jgi:hypothetical protein
MEMTEQPRPITHGRRSFPVSALVIYAQNRANQTGRIEYIDTEDGIIEVHPHPVTTKAYRGG